MSLRFGNVRLSNAGLTVGSNIRVSLSNVSVGSVRLSGNSVAAPTASVDALMGNTLVTSNSAVVRSVTANTVTANFIAVSNISVGNVLVANVFSAKSIMADTENLDSLTVNTVSANHVSVPVITMSAAAAFTGNYSTLSGQPVQSVQNAGTQLLNAKLFTATALTVANGTVTFYPTSTGTSNGTPLFSQITTIQCSPWANTSTATSIPNIAGKYVSSDLSSVVFNVTQGQNVVLGGAPSTFASNGIPCMCFITGT